MKRIKILTEYRSPEEIADRIIDALIESGFDFDQILEIIELAKEKLTALKAPVCPECNSDLIYDFDTKHACDECGFVWNKKD